MTLRTIGLVLLFATGVGCSEQAADPETNIQGQSVPGATAPASSTGVAGATRSGAVAGTSAGLSTGAAGRSSVSAPSAGSGGVTTGGQAGSTAAGAGGSPAAGSGGSLAAGSGGAAAVAGSGGEPAAGAGGGAGTAIAGASGAGGRAGASGAAGVSGAGGRAGASGAAGSAGADGSATDECPVVVADADCDETQRPFVFVHGTYGSGDNLTHVAQLFGSNGFCQDRFVGVEYNSVVFLNNDTAPAIDAVVDAIRAKTGQDKVDIACHSQGTYQCSNYLSDRTRAAKVAHYINLSGGVTVPNNVPTLSISSNNDLGGRPAHATNADARVTFEDLDHMGVASSTEAFVEMWKYLHDGAEPKYKTIQCGADPITIEALVETFADNQPVANAKVEAFEITATPRERGTAAASQTSDAQGRVPAFTLKRNVQYELLASDASGKSISRAYFAPFKRSNRLVRFLAPSSDPSVQSTSSGMVATGAGFSAVSARYLGGAFRADLDEELLIDGSNALTDMTAGRTMVTVGLYMSDQNKNGMSELGLSFSSNFLAGTDVFLDARTPAFIEFTWKDPFGAETKLKVPNWPSTEGILLVTFP